MRWAHTVMQPPALEPVSLDEAKAHLRVTSADEDAYIASLITAAREWCEGFQQRAYVTQTRKLVLDRFPGGCAIYLPRPPLQSVTSIVYTDSEGAQYTVDADSYIVDTDAEPGRIVLAYGASWPSVTLRPAAGVEITYVAGYGDASDVPQKVKQAMLLLVGHWYEQREAVLVGSISKEIEFAVHSLLWQDRVFYGSPEVW